jgi:ATP-dependent DNA helicase RecG
MARRVPADDRIPHTTDAPRARSQDGTRSMNAAALLAQLDELDEHDRIEAKTGRELGPAVLTTVCAFANEPGLGGGHLLLGVQRRDGPGTGRFEVVGIPEPDKVLADLATQCASMFNRPLRPQAATEMVQGRPLIRVFVPEARPEDKPIFFKSQGLPRGAYRRIGSTDQRCTEEDLAVLYEGRSTGSFDVTPLVEAELSDFDPDAFAEYRRVRGAANPDAEELRWSDEDLLTALRCAVRTDERLVPTVAGIVLFGSARAQRRLFPMLRIDYIRVPGREWMRDLREPLQTLEKRGPLLLVIAQVLAAVLEDIPIALLLPPGEIQRRDEPLVPVRVVREALVNAVMHRSYRLNSPMQILRYANRLEIRNPGHSLVALDRLGDPGSRTRNPAIAAVLHETRFAESKGSGIRIMREMMRAAGLSPPAFDSDRERDEFVATLLFHHFLGPEDVAWLAQFQRHGLADDEARILVFAREKGQITNAECRNLTGLDTLAISQHLRRLRDLGLLEQHERGRAAYYTPSPPLRQVEAEAAAPAAKAPLLPELPALPPELQRLLPEFPDVPPELWPALARLGKRSPPSDVREVVRRLCALRPFRLEELARLLRRQPDWVRKSYTTPMVREGVLEYTAGATPTHPGQAYRAATTRR